MTMIANKWSNTRNGIEKNRRVKADALEEYLNEIERTLADISGDSHINVRFWIFQENNFQEIKQKIAIIQEDLALEQNEIEILEETQQKSLQDIEESTSELVEEMKHVKNTNSNSRAIRNGSEN